MANFNWTPSPQDYADSVDQWKRNVGEEDTDRQWLLTNFDTWVKNPHYVGPDQRHPEDYEFDID
tara:strand:+ start:388 stop:579 length:192 start_codon:yes stop_codon:yes gene_type:complete